MPGFGESSCNEQKDEFTESTSSSEEFGHLPEEAFYWETSGEEGYDEVEMMVEVSSTEGHGYTPSSNVPSAQNTTSDVSPLSTIAETPETVGTEGSQPAEEAADEGSLTSQTADYSDSDVKALESRPAPDEEIEPDAEEDLDLIPAEGPQGDEEPSTPPSPPEISEPLESLEDIEDKAMESQAAPDMSEEDIFMDAESEEPQQADVTQQMLERSAHHVETTEKHDAEAGLPDADHKEEESRPFVPVESQKTDPEGILFSGSKSLEEADVERERKYFESTKDLDDLEEPFIDVAWAYGSVGAPESMVEFDLKLELAAASAIQPDADMDKTTTSSSQTDFTETQEEAEAAASAIQPAFEEEAPSSQTDVAETLEEAEAAASAIQPEAFEEEAPSSQTDETLEEAEAAASAIQPEAFEEEAHSSQTDETQEEADAPAVAEVIPAIPMRKPEPRYKTVLEERTEFTGSEGFVTLIPRKVIVEEPFEETTESVGSHDRRDDNQPTEVFASTEDTEERSTADSVTSFDPQSTQSSTQDVSESTTEDSSPEFIDNPIDFIPTDSGQSSTSQGEQSSSGSLAESGETLTAANRKARAKHKNDLANGSLPNTDCAVSHLIPCGNGRVTKDECRDLGCCWLPLGRHFISVDCYLPRSAANLDPHVSV